MNTPLGVYISVPFCKAKCTFCNFASGAFAHERLQNYVDTLEAEIRGARAAAEQLGANLVRPVDTVYFG
ncbi:MAG TPA: coproporphyrinogen III oxidase family protein, partial [Edaphobacter sp.]